LFLSMLARLLLVAGHSAEALEVAARALDEAGDDPSARAEAMFAHTRVDWVWKREAQRVIGPAREGLRLARAAGTREVEAAALGLVGAITLWGLDLPDEALAIYASAEALYLQLGNPRGALQATHGRMGCLYATGRFEQAIGMGEGLARQAEALGNIEAHLVALNLLAACQVRLRRFADALSTGQAEARLAQRHHKVYNLVNALWGQGHCLARLRRPEEAAVLMAFSERFWTEHLGPLPPDEQRQRAKVRRLVRLQLGAAAAQTAWSRGQALGEREGVRLGMGEG
jgi:tetratricopeptide (TPR) repeat protein